MAKNPGQALNAGVITVTLTGDGTASDGDAVAMSAGKVTQADGTNDPHVIGVLAQEQGSKTDTEKVSVHIAGPVVANVASGTAAGTQLGSSATEGQFGSGTQAISTLTPEGDAGDYGGTMPTGYAAVNL
ncbi:hypothetical protein [Halopelagius fulvigenes]|uniref:DUF2190 family protein n=1 Tax=Halopelagius fulvigenes TaxID=1198324 RepID=A0ABD5U1B6_9EURY